MANYRSYDNRQQQFMIIQPEKLLEENRLLATIDGFVEEHTDMEAFAKKVSNDKAGAPAIDPRLLLKVLFYSYATGVYSSREIESRTGWDINYIFLCAGKSLDHSTLCNFILKYEEEILAIFTRLLYVAQILGLVGQDFIAVDGTKIRANVDKEFTGTVEEFFEKKIHLEQKIIERLKQTADEDSKYQERSRKKILQMERSLGRIGEFLEKIGNEEGEGKIKSLSDPEASIVKDQDRKYPGYNCQAAVDDKHHMIVANDVTNQENDSHMLAPMVEEIRKQTGNDLQNTDLGVDSGYSTSESLSWANDEKLKLYMPSGRGPGGQQNLREDQITSRHCELKIEGDQRLLTCPGGQTMTVTKSIRTSRAENYSFEPDAAECEGCEFKEICYKNVRKTKKKFIVRRDYFENLPLRQQMIHRLSCLKGKHRMADRSCVVEHVFGEIKELRSFRRFFHRGVKKVKLIWTIVCTAYNFRKIAVVGIT
jgi:transposase